jgi:hypothetical protein
MTVLLAVLGAALGLLTGGVAAAQERPPLLLNLTTRPAETADRALQETLREDARSARPAATADVEVLPDGSVRIGRTRITVTVKDACPEETHGLDVGPRPLPGRARR